MTDGYPVTDRRALEILLEIADEVYGGLEEGIVRLKDDMLAGRLSHRTTGEVVCVVLRNTAHRNPGVAHSVYQDLGRRLEAKARGRDMTLTQLLGAHARGESIETH